jgi:divalent metal cation (Fe/Co/Zn/Cd) transporter
MIKKTDILLVITVIIGLIIFYLGIFLISYQTDEITSITNAEHWEWEWENQQPYIGIGIVFLTIGILFILIGVAFLLKRMMKNPKKSL